MDKLLELWFVITLLWFFLLWFVIIFAWILFHFKIIVIIVHPVHFWTNFIKCETLSSHLFQKYLSNLEISQTYLTKTQFLSQFFTVFIRIYILNEFQRLLTERSLWLWVAHPNHLIFINLEVIWETKPMINWYHKYFFVLLICLCLSYTNFFNQNICLISITVQNS